MKILIVRFSSIGDIVLTTPVVRCLKQQIPGVEIHYITKQSFRQVIEHNPNIDRFFYIQSSVKEVLPALKKEQYDYVIDLHHNTRTLQLKLALGVKSFSFDKLNKEKFMLVHFRMNRLPDKHIVDRYFEALHPLGITNDRKGLDYFIDPQDEINTKEFLPDIFSQGYYALVAGGSYYTKRIPENKLKEICTKVKLPLVILGGPEDAAVAQQIQDAFPEKAFNACGKVRLNQSASLIRQAQHVISSDTGLMHIAAAYKKSITSVWGNTIPEFGMYPYLPGDGSSILEVKNLGCRPCSKLGFKKCPKGHFKCMNDLEIPDQL
ncbi:MAG: glycosyltransferase family 9 protein [Bacteroidetes bacterium]|nr:glycosyltransferase family 9 protein [Bacteroidota bacterium]